MIIYLNHLDQKRFHSAYEELLKNPYVKYIYEKKLSNFEIKNTNLSFSIAKFFFNFLNLPNTNFILRDDFDLIHSCQSIPISKKNFVVDFEHVSAFGGWRYSRVNNPLFKYLLKRFLESNRCKKILPWTKASALSLKNLIKSNIINKKIEVIYPTIEPIEFKKIKHKEVIFLFVAFNFYRKGGEEAAEAFERSNIKARFIMVCEKKEEFKKYKKIEFVGLKSKKELYEKYYPMADVFLYPTFNDSYGMVFLEAMSFGLPIITLEDFSSKELIEDGKNGFVIKGYKKKWYDENHQTRKGSNDINNVLSWRTKEEKERIINDLSEKIKLLYENKKLRKAIGEYNLYEIRKGRFSIEKRNKRVYEIYKESIS